MKNIPVPNPPPAISAENGRSKEMTDMVQSHEKFAAANEIRKFRRMFQTVFALGERLEAEASLEQSIEGRERKLAAIAQKEEEVLAELQGKIAAAEEKLASINSEVRTRWPELARIEESLSRRSTEAEEELKKLDAQIEERQRKLAEVEDRLASIRATI